MSTIPAPAVAVVGNPRARSRTAALADRVLTTLSRELWSLEPATDATIDLAGLSDTLGASLGANVAHRWAEPLHRLHSARLIVVATPVYKGSYSGLLKAFLDQVDGGALTGQVAVPVVTPGSPAHTLAAEVHLRPLLVELGASVPTRSLVVQAEHLDEPGATLSDWLRDALPVLRPLLVTEPVGAASRAGAPS